MKTYKIVRVDWIDSMSHSGWYDGKQRENDGCASCISYGIHVKTKRGTYGVTHSVADDGELSSTIVIPRKAIKKIEIISKFKA